MFRDFIRRKDVNYAIIDDPYPEAPVSTSLVPKPTLEGLVPEVATIEPPRATVYVVRYTDALSNGKPNPHGTVAYKTLIHGLMTDREVWIKRFDQAIWRSIADLQFKMEGGLHFGSDDEGQRYEFRYTKGKRDVDTLFPAHIT